MKYCEWLKDWVDIYKKPYIKSWKKIKDIVRLHIPDKIKNCELLELNALIVQKALNEVKSSRMKLETFDVYHGSLLMAYKLGLIEKNISVFLIKPKHTRKVGSALSKDELCNFIDALKKTRYKNFYLFCLYTGCRRSEALSVKWEDVDFDKKTIHIHGTKTETSDRVIPPLS